MAHFPWRASNIFLQTRISLIFFSSQMGKKTKKTIACEKRRKWYISKKTSRERERETGTHILSCYRFINIYLSVRAREGLPLSADYFGRERLIDHLSRANFELSNGGRARSTSFGFSADVTSRRFLVVEHFIIIFHVSVCVCACVGLRTGRAAVAERRSE